MADCGQYAGAPCPPPPPEGGIGTAVHIGPLSTQLPYTGAELAWYVGLGVALLVLGALLIMAPIIHDLMATRAARRRARVIPPRR